MRAFTIFYLQMIFNVYSIDEFRGRFSTGRLAGELGVRYNDWLTNDTHGAGQTLLITDVPVMSHNTLVPETHSQTLPSVWTYGTLKITKTSTSPNIATLRPTFRPTVKLLVSSHPQYRLREYLTGGVPDLVMIEATRGMQPDYGTVIASVVKVDSEETYDVRLPPTTPKTRNSPSPGAGRGRGGRQRPYARGSSSSVSSPTDTLANDPNFQGSPSIGRGHGRVRRSSNVSASPPPVEPPVEKKRLRSSERIAKQEKKPKLEAVHSQLSAEHTVPQTVPVTPEKKSVLERVITREMIGLPFVTRDATAATVPGTITEAMIGIPLMPINLQEREAQRSATETRPARLDSDVAIRGMFSSSLPRLPSTSVEPSVPVTPQGAVETDNMPSYYRQRILEHEAAKRKNKAELKTYTPCAINSNTQKFLREQQLRQQIQQSQIELQMIQQPQFGPSQFGSLTNVEVTRITGQSGQFFTEQNQLIPGISRNSSTLSHNTSQVLISNWTDDASSLIRDIQTPVDLNQRLDMDSSFPVALAEWMDNNPDQLPAMNPMAMTSRETRGEGETQGGAQVRYSDQPAAPSSPDQQ